MAELAPLVTTPDAPAPQGGQAEWFRGAGGARLRAALFTPEGRTRGTIILSGGRTEPIEKYYLLRMEERPCALHRDEAGLIHFPRGATRLGVRGCGTGKGEDALSAFRVVHEAQLHQFPCGDPGFFQRLPAGGVLLVSSTGAGSCAAFLANRSSCQIKKVIS